MTPPYHPDLFEREGSQTPPVKSTASVQADSVKVPGHDAHHRDTSSADILQQQFTNQLLAALPSYSCEVPDHAALNKAADYVEEVLERNGFYKRLYQTDIPCPSSRQPIHDPASGLSSQSTSVGESDNLGNNSRNSRSDMTEAQHDELASGMDDITREFERLQQQVKDMVAAPKAVEKHVPTPVKEASQHKSGGAGEGNDIP